MVYRLKPNFIFADMLCRLFSAILIGTIVLVPSVELGSQPSRRDREPRPTIANSRGEWRVDLPPRVEDAIRRYDRDFEPWSSDDYRGVDLGPYERSSRQVPWAVVGDFNGDGLMDVAIAGRTEDELVSLMIVSDGDRKYRVLTMDVEPYDREERKRTRPPVLSYVYPGKYRIEDSERRRGRQRGGRAVRELEVGKPAVQIAGGRRPGAALYVVNKMTVTPYYLVDPLNTRRDHGDLRRID